MTDCCVPSCAEKNLHSFNSKNCKFCDELCCMEHIQLESHDCIKVRYVTFVRKKVLRQNTNVNTARNISSGQYCVVCDNCNYQSDYALIDEAGQKREFHISNGCEGSKVFLEGLK